jgi:hemophore-related protein
VNDARPCRRPKERPRETSYRRICCSRSRVLRRLDPAHRQCRSEPAAADDCNASTLAQTVSSVTASLSQYFAAHPDANQALIDITRQPAFVAVGQMDGYFNDHPDQADNLRAVQQPLVDYKNRCGMEVSPTDALTVLADV